MCTGHTVAHQRRSKNMHNNEIVTVQGTQYEIEKKFDTAFNARRAKRIPDDGRLYTVKSNNRQTWYEEQFGKELRRGVDLQRTLRNVMRRVGAPRLVTDEECGKEYRYVYEWIEGEDLADIFDMPDVRMTVTHIRTLVARIASIAGILMENRLIHRDIKPGNCVVKRKDKNAPNGAYDFSHTRIIDWDMVCALGDSLVSDGFGTPAFTAPEQLDNRPARTSDVYALGMTAFEAMCTIVSLGVDKTYELIFNNDNDNKTMIYRRKRDNQWIKQEARRNFEIDILPCIAEEQREKARILFEFIMACVQHDPQARPQTGEELQQRLFTKQNIKEI